MNEALHVLRTRKGPRKGVAQFGDPRMVAIDVLGEYRAPEAVSALLELLDLQVKDVYLTELRPITPGDWFPAAGALAKIGSPAVRECVWQLTREVHDDGTRERLCWVIGAVEGRGAGRFRIEQTIRKLEADADALPPESRNARAEFEAKADRLRSALTTLERLFPDDE